MYVSMYLSKIEREDIFSTLIHSSFICSTICQPFLPFLDTLHRGIYYPLLTCPHVQIPVDSQLSS